MTLPKLTDRRSTRRPRGTTLVLAALMTAALPGMPKVATPAAAATTLSIDAHDRQAVKAMLVEEALRFGVPPALALALAKIESDFQPRARGRDGALGVLQILPATAVRENGVERDELIEPRLNIQIGLDRLARLHQQLGGKDSDWEKALAAYHADRRDVVGAQAILESPAFVAEVMRWQLLYAAQADLWDELDSRDAERFGERSPQPSRTTVAAEVTAQPRVTAELEPATFEQRRAAASWWLDDFGPRRLANRVRVW